MRIHIPLTVPRHAKRKTTRVHDAHPKHAPSHPPPGIHNRHVVFLAAHRARRRSVMHRPDVAPAQDGGEDLRVRGDVRAGEDLLAHVRHGAPRGAQAAVAQDGNFLVARVTEPVGVQEGRVGVGGRGDGHVAAGEGGNEDGDGAGEDGGRGRGGERSGVAVGEVFEEGPVRGQRGEGGARKVGEVDAVGGGDDVPVVYG